MDVGQLVKYSKSCGIIYIGVLDSKCWMACLLVPAGVVYDNRYNRSKGCVHRSTTYSVDQPTECETAWYQ